ncbi:hypothetical protein SAMN05444280_108124 [Tangfeifania diversioriginum]|uniref:Uncharacterized protein n=1 Tax=Tangfeifania diversioriginum TaxID=1168035 RepID=A0A1M6FCW9_9BACT|nr:hypothetical protein [Tangfeifania diversioriginum]SHI95594.1 hypothetical protein SAMN05444280_108124 [Tangfeifania diversioriginum]
MNYSIIPIPEKEKGRFNAMTKQDRILWHNRFIQIIDGITAEHEWQRHTTTNDLPEHELDKAANLYRENKQKFLYFKERAEYLGNLLQLDPDASMLEYSPQNSFLVPKGVEEYAYKQMTPRELEMTYLQFTKILTGIDESLKYWQSGNYINDPAKKGGDTLINYNHEIRSYFSERLKLIVELIQNHSLQDDPDPRNIY